eukprot:761301-Hanusia_phi.AAC.2
MMMRSRLPESGTELRRLSRSRAAARAGSDHVKGDEGALGVRSLPVSNGDLAMGVAAVGRCGDGERGGWGTKVLADSNFEHDTQSVTGATTGDWFVEFYAPWVRDLSCITVLLLLTTITVRALQVAASDLGKFGAEAKRREGGG